MGRLGEVASAALGREPYIDIGAHFPQDGRSTTTGACRPGPRTHASDMFVVTEADAAAIRAAFDRGGEFSAAVELRRLFPCITDNVQARECARTIAGWKPLPAKPRVVRRLRPRGD
jgi:hypothetical protein